MENKNKDRKTTPGIGSLFASASTFALLDRIAYVSPKLHKERFEMPERDSEPCPGSQIPFKQELLA